MNAPSPAHDDDRVEEEEVFLDESDIIHEIPVDEEGQCYIYTHI